MNEAQSAYSEIVVTSLHPINHRCTVPPSNVHTVSSVMFQDQTKAVCLSCCSGFTWGDSEAWRWRVWGGPACSRWLSWGTEFHHSAPRFLQTAWAGSLRPFSWSNRSPPDSARTSPYRLSLSGGRIKKYIWAVDCRLEDGRLQLGLWKIVMWFS